MLVGVGDSVVVPLVTSDVEVTVPVGSIVLELLQIAVLELKTELDESWDELAEPLVPVSEGTPRVVIVCPVVISPVCVVVAVTVSYVVIVIVRVVSFYNKVKRNKEH